MVNSENLNMNLVPMVVEQSNRGERAYDIFSRLLFISLFNLFSLTISIFSIFKSFFSFKKIGLYPQLATANNNKTIVIKFFFILKLN